MAKKVGPKRSSKPAWPLIRIDFALQWYVTSAYTMVAMATPVKRKAEMKAGRSPKLSMPIARAPRMTVKLSHERNVRSLAKKTLGSTRVGRAMRLPVERGKRMMSAGRKRRGTESKICWLTWRSLKERLTRHDDDVYIWFVYGYFG